ncbi:MAG TPA: class I SAM-dependent methyltransferase [Polyangiaceae bacterium]|jgi:2-polyprenyl-3-methyl-5-hydroxy-6-metoxy-1,4-benzoquinol methylase|nr:class I SAM-dependent methyltransferase [Polyangiaceae bacterium]
MDYDHSALGAAMIRRLPKAPLTAKGQIRLPAIPALLEAHIERLNTLFTSFGRAFNEADLNHLREILRRKMEEGYKQTPYAGVLVQYETQGLPKTGLNYRVGLVITTMADEYAEWVKTRKPPLFGAHPDAKVMDLARSIGTPAEVPVLDIGAGTGRNTLPLARAGFPAGAVELSPDLVALLRREIESEGLDVKVFEGNMLTDELGLTRRQYRLIIACEVVSHFRTVAEVGVFFRKTAELLAPGGLLAFSVFLADEGYEPDPIAFELSQAQWCTLYTRGQLAEVGQGVELELVSDESVYEYEHEHLPKEAWPPTGWFADWSTGLDLFDLPREESPIDMRWLVYRRT